MQREFVLNALINNFWKTIFKSYFNSHVDSHHTYFSPFLFVSQQRLFMVIFVTEQKMIKSFRQVYFKLTFLVDASCKIFSSLPIWNITKFEINLIIYWTVPSQYHLTEWKLMIPLCQNFLQWLDVLKGPRFSSSLLWLMKMKI